MGSPLFYFILLIIVLLHSPTFSTTRFVHPPTSSYVKITFFFLLPTQHHSKDEQKKKKNEPNPNFLEFNPNLRIKIRARLKNINLIKFGSGFGSSPTYLPDYLITKKKNLCFYLNCVFI